MTEVNGCPTCGGSYAARQRKGGRMFIGARNNRWYGAWNDRRTDGRRPIRVYWKNEVSHIGGTYGVCPDKYHERNRSDFSRYPKPTPKPNEVTELNPDRVNAPSRAKARAKKHRVNQSKDKR